MENRIFFDVGRLGSRPLPITATGVGQVPRTADFPVAGLPFIFYYGKVKDWH